MPDVSELERAIQQVGREIAARMPEPRKLSIAAAEQRITDLMMQDDGLRAALFRFVDVRPACTDSADVVRHLQELLEEADDSRAAQRAARVLDSRAATRPAARAAGAAVSHMAERFIVGETPAVAAPVIERFWSDGAATTVDLLGEATVSEAEADRYAARCSEALQVLAARSAAWPQRPLLERDSSGALPRVNLSVKVSALTPHLRASAPQRGVEGARERLRHLLRQARDAGAHLHVDMEAFDTREAIEDLTLGLLAEDEFAEGPSAGLVLQAYLVESPEHLDAILNWAREHPRAQPLTVRLVKGAYWDHEVVESEQHGWTAPVFTDRHECDRNYEALTRRLIDSTGLVRPAIASHNLRSVAHAAAYADTCGRAQDVEFQVLRGLGDETQLALTATGRRVRVYCPIGDLVSGMAYLVRRLLENTANDSFLAAQHAGTDLDQLLAAP